MCEKPKFFICKHCGNIIMKIKDAGVPVVCCGENMTELTLNTEDASLEKHVPVIEKEEGKVIVTVGSVPHPMTEEHHIAWIYLETDKGGQLKCFNINDEPTLSFALCKDEKAVAAYAYCNLHGLWMAKA